MSNNPQMRSPVRGRSRHRPVRGADLGPVHLLMDESGNGNPAGVLLVGGVAADRQFDQLDGDMNSLYRAWAAQEARLGGSKSFDEFKERGFHGGQMPAEAQFALLEFLASRLSFKVFLMASDRSRMPTISETRRLILMYTLLLEDVVIRFRRHSHIIVQVEDNDALRPHLVRICDEVAARAKRKASNLIEAELSIEMVPKNSPMTLAVIDFYMFVVQRRMNAGGKRDGASADYRNFAALESSISFLTSLENGVISNRSSRISS